MDACLDDSVLDTQTIDLDVDKLYRVELQERQRMYSSGFPGLAHVAEYGTGHVWNTNAAENWRGIWSVDTNTGWRVNLCPWKTNTVNMGVIVKVGSVVSNSGVGLMPSPTGKYARLELLDANGKTVASRSGAARVLYEIKYASSTFEIRLWTNGRRQTMRL